jgi:hypothetical protein
MIPTENLNVEYHQQDTDYYCGAACAQMVLNQIGAGLLSQDDLYNDNNTHNSPAEKTEGWYSGPTGLAWTMVARKPAAFINTFLIFSETSEESISRKIIWTIHHYQVAPIALVYGWDHWIVVKGYMATAAPASSDDISYAISAFFINNSLPQTPAGIVPPPHGSSDLCGSGGDRGIANQFITYGTWQSDYMTGVPAGSWGGKFLAVCDPELPPRIPGERVHLNRVYDGERIIDKELAARHAMEGLQYYELAKLEFLEEILENIHPGEPRLVQRLDKFNEYYYIVPILGKDDNVRCLTSVDARFGNFREAVFAKEVTKPLLFKPLTVEEIKYRLSKLKRIELKEEHRILTLHIEAMCIYPSLVWKPCKQSLSPFLAFHLVTIGNHQLYIRVDGEIFTTLEPNRPGM